MEFSSYIGHVGYNLEHYLHLYAISGIMSFKGKNRQFHTPFIFPL